jgi:hypothetical protein
MKSIINKILNQLKRKYILRICTLALLQCLIEVQAIAQTYCTPVYNTVSASCTLNYGRIYNLHVSGANRSDLDDTPPRTPDYKDRTDAPPLKLTCDSTFYGNINYTISGKYLKKTSGKIKSHI